MKKTKFFYGWIIVFAAISLVFLDGLLLYSFGVLLPSIQAKFEMTKAAVNSIFAVRCIVFAFSMILFGKLIDKHKPEKVVFFGGQAARNLEIQQELKCFKALIYLQMQ